MLVEGDGEGVVKLVLKAGLGLLFCREKGEEERRERDGRGESGVVKFSPTKIRRWESMGDKKTDSKKLNRRREEIQGFMKK